MEHENPEQSSSGPSRLDPAPNESDATWQKMKSEYSAARIALEDGANWKDLYQKMMATMKERLDQAGVQNQRLSSELKKTSGELGKARKDNSRLRGERSKLQNELHKLRVSKDKSEEDAQQAREARDAYEERAKSAEGRSAKAELDFGQMQERFDSEKAELVQQNVELQVASLHALRLQSESDTQPASNPGELNDQPDHDQPNHDDCTALQNALQQRTAEVS
jgi:chromosome segregation ATPase